MARLRYDEDPDYEYCQKLLEKGLKDLKCPLQGKLDFSGKISVKRSSPKKSNSTSLSNDTEAQSSDTKPHHKKKGAVASGNQQWKRAKGYNPNFSGSNSSAESDDEHDEANSYKKRVMLSNTDTKSKTKSVSSWKDCPTAVASNVRRPGEYTRRNDDDKKQRAKKQKKKTDDW